MRAILRRYDTPEIMEEISSTDCKVGIPQILWDLTRELSGNTSAAWLLIAKRSMYIGDPSRGGCHDNVADSIIMQFSIFALQPA